MFKLSSFSTNFSRRKKREKKREKNDNTSATVLVIANESGGARRGNERGNGMRAEKRHRREKEKEGRTGKEGRVRRAEGSVVMGSSYRAE